MRGNSLQAEDSLASQECRCFMDLIILNIKLMITLLNSVTPCDCSNVTE